MQGTSRTTEGARHSDRDAQFHDIKGRVKQFTAAGQPVISVDTKKKELADFAHVADLEVTVCHFPPGTSKV